jgi:hypothetical protein
LPVRCGVQHPVPALFPVYLAYSLSTSPPFRSNTIAFAALKEGKDFGTVRAGARWAGSWRWPFIFILGAHSTAVDVRAIFIVSAVISLVLAAFSLTLPHTPPQKGGDDSLAWRRALGLLKKPYVAVLFFVTFIDRWCITAIS